MTAPRLLLLTGVPGTGKTTMADYLRDVHGFRHLDFEHAATFRRFLRRGDARFRDRVEQMLAGRYDTVISWGFVPGTQLEAVLHLRSVGFHWFWFDGNREAARAAFLARGDVPLELLEQQLARIDADLDLERLAPTVVDTFDGAGRFRSKAELARVLLA